MQSLVYKFYNKNNQLLYVGITKNFRIRLEQHQKDKEWFKDVDKIFITHKMSRNAVHIYEIHIIANEKPIYNSDFTNGGEVNFDLPFIEFKEYIPKKPKSTKPKIDMNVVLELYKQGKTIDEIADNLNYSSGYMTQYLRNLLDDLGIRKKQRRNSQGERLKILTDILENFKSSDKDYLTTQNLLDEFMEIYGCGYEMANEYYKNEFTKVINEILEGYDLQRIRANKILKEKHGIISDGYPFIIVKN